MINKLPLSELTLNVTDGKHGDCLNEDNSGYYFLSVKDIKQDKIDFENARQITEADFIETHKRTKLEEGDILLANSGHTIGKMFYVLDCPQINKTTFQKSVAIIKADTSKINGNYLYYSLLANVTGLRRAAVGSAQPNLLLRDLRNFQVPTHNNREQQNSISRVMSAFDEKIKLNNKINAELEAMAKLIYDYWFVQFDFPDANGNPYKSSGGKMVYNQELKREIPVGWDVEVINNIIKVKDGTHDSPKSKDSGYPLITSKHLKPEGLDFATANLISAEDYESVNKRSKVDTGDILFSMIGSIGEIYKVDEQQINFAIKNVGLYKSSEKPEYANYLYMFLKSYDMQRYMGNVTSGSIQKFIGLGALRSMPIFLNEGMIKKFVNTTEQLFQKKTLIKLENQKLTQLRDWLLPMLMNGQVTIKL
tara:strand:+ start:29384 stop:30646 length:1263 start_codon:yes stop_codon:yes gene_type:complete